MGEAYASWPSLERGMSAQNCLPITVEHIARANDHERAEDETSATRTLNESLNLKKSDPRPPPMTLEALKLSVATFAALLWAIFGNHCDLYRKVKSFRETLDTPAVDFKLHCYTPRIIMEYWFDILDKSRMYFYTMLRKSDYEKPSGPQFPISALSSSFPNILAGSGIENGNFPEKWSGATTANVSGGAGGVWRAGAASGGRFGSGPSSGYGGGVSGGNRGGGGEGSNFQGRRSRGSSTPSWNWNRQPDQGPPPMFKNVTDHCHPIVKQEF